LQEPSLNNLGRMSVASFVPSASFAAESSPGPASSALRDVRCTTYKATLEDRDETAAW